MNKIRNSSSIFYRIFEDEKGVYINQDIWRKNEIIELSSPFVMSGYGLLYYIHYCNQFLDNEEVKDKSKTFEGDT